jgi:hemerythrin-like metal-binding protein
MHAYGIVNDRPCCIAGIHHAPLPTLDPSVGPGTKDYMSAIDCSTHARTDNSTAKMIEPIVFPQMGIAEVDAEHAGLLECLQRLQLYVDKGHGFAASIDAVLQLKTYAVAHFTHEEAYLKEHGFPNLAAHIKQHQAITKYVAELYDRVLEGEEIEAPLVAMMRDWIIKHIGVEDMEFAVHFGTADGKSSQAITLNGGTAARPAIGRDPATT